MLALRSFATLAAVCALAGTAYADGTDPATLYDLSTEGTTAKVSAGGKGTFVLTIQPKGPAHVSDDAPLKLELSGTLLTPAQAKLGAQDSVAKKQPGQTYANPRFEVPFTAAGEGAGSIAAKLTFVVCNDQICARQVRTLTVPVTIGR